MPLKPQESIAHPHSYHAKVSLHKILFASVGISVPTLSWISGVSRYLQSVVEGSSYCCFFIFLRYSPFKVVLRCRSKAVIPRAVSYGLSLSPSLYPCARVCEEGNKREYSLVHLRSGGRQRLNGSKGAGCAELASGRVTRRMKGEVRDIFSTPGLLRKIGFFSPTPVIPAGKFSRKCISSNSV